MERCVSQYLHFCTLAQLFYFLLLSSMGRDDGIGKGGGCIDWMSG